MFTEDMLMKLLRLYIVLRSVFATGDDISDKAFSYTYPVPGYFFQNFPSVN